MTWEIKRLELATLQGLDGSRWPVHGFVVTHPGGAVLVDTGVGGPQDVLDDWRVVNRTVAEALGEHVFENFLVNKRREWADYKADVTPFEIARYLGTL